MPEDPAISARHVFVYGTLRRGDDNDITRLRPEPRWVGPARIKGVMYHFGRYPGVALGGADDVVGEVYEISPALEAVLDEIEEVYPQQTNEYAKRVIGVDVQGRRVECIVYEINPDRLGGRARIASGDWVKDR
ncbi:MAG: gamma-glutamylcyclotransferase [Ramlibacter sp.]